jgi:hypothetical protein
MVQTADYKPEYKLSTVIGKHCLAHLMWPGPSQSEDAFAGLK